MCHPCNEKRQERGFGCDCGPTGDLEDEIRMLEAMRSLQVVRLDAIDRRIQGLKRMRNG